MGTPTRPALRYMGGKWRIAPRIVELMPPHHTYIEPFGGAGSVLMIKPRSVGEIYNDLDGEVANFFRVLRDRDLAQQLVDQLSLTPFSRDEFDACWGREGEPLERARRLVVRCNMGFGATAPGRVRRTGWRSHSVKRDVSYATDWARVPCNLLPIIERLQGVTIENRPALSVMQANDSANTLIFADPPYLPETRAGGGAHGLEAQYACEMSEADHRKLLAYLRDAKSMVLLSGYPSELYDGTLEGWSRVEIKARANGNSPRTEVVWLNPAVQRAHAARELFQTMEA